MQTPGITRNSLSLHTAHVCLHLTQASSLRIPEYDVFAQDSITRHNLPSLLGSHGPSAGSLLRMETEEHLRKFSQLSHHEPGLATPVTFIMSCSYTYHSLPHIILSSQIYFLIYFFLHLIYLPWPSNFTQSMFRRLTGSVKKAQNLTWVQVLPLSLTSSPRLAKKQRQIKLQYRRVEI